MDLVCNWLERAELFFTKRIFIYLVFDRLIVEPRDVRQNCDLNSESYSEEDVYKRSCSYAKRKHELDLFNRIKASSMFTNAIFKLLKQNFAKRVDSFPLNISRYLN